MPNHPVVYKDADVSKYEARKKLYLGLGYKLESENETNEGKVCLLTHDTMKVTIILTK